MASVIPFVGLVTGVCFGIKEVYNGIMDMQLVKLHQEHVHVSQDTELPQLIQSMQVFLRINYLIVFDGLILTQSFYD